MTSDIEAILSGGNPNKNQTFTGVSETIQPIWGKQYHLLNICPPPTYIAHNES